MFQDTSFPDKGHRFLSAPNTQAKYGAVFIKWVQVALSLGVKKTRAEAK
jgi:hypothetical protein